MTDGPLDNIKRESERLSASYLALKCAPHVDDAVRTILDLMRHGKREQVKLRAASLVLELAAGQEPTAPGAAENGAPRVYVVVQQGETVSDELRRRKAIVANAEVSDRSDPDQ